MNHRISFMMAALAIATPGGAWAGANYLKAGFGMPKDRRPGVIVIHPQISMNAQGPNQTNVPHLEWTEVAHVNLRAALEASTPAKSVNFRFMSKAEAKDSPVYADLIASFVKRTGEIIFQVPQDSDPVTNAKKCKCTYSMGKDLVAKFRNAYPQAEFGLIINQTDTYATFGQKLGEVAGAALGGVVTPSGTSAPKRYMRLHAGNALLFDLSSGEVIWFHGDGAFGGDLRKPESARVRINQVMTKFPTAPQ